jgi:flavin-dependent dehydrogenase
MVFFSLSAGVLVLTYQATALSWQQPTGILQYGSFFGLPGQNATYDYIIIGGGTAGLTVASRLAENKSLSIAVVEAGTFAEISNGNGSQVPAYSYGSVSGGGGYVNQWIDWELNTVPQTVSKKASPIQEEKSTLIEDGVTDELSTIAT